MITANFDRGSSYAPRPTPLPRPLTTPPRPRRTRPSSTPSSTRPPTRSTSKKGSPTHPRPRGHRRATPTARPSAVLQLLPHPHQLEGNPPGRYFGNGLLSTVGHPVVAHDFFPDLRVVDAGRGPRRQARPVGDGHDGCRVRCGGCCFDGGDLPLSAEPSLSAGAEGGLTRMNPLLHRCTSLYYFAFPSSYLYPYIVFFVGTPLVMYSLPQHTVCWLRRECPRSGFSEPIPSLPLLHSSPTLTRQQESKAESNPVGGSLLPRRRRPPSHLPKLSPSPTKESRRGKEEGGLIRRHLITTRFIIFLG